MLKARLAKMEPSDELEEPIEPAPESEPVEEELNKYHVAITVATLVQVAVKYMSDQRSHRVQLVCTTVFFTTVLICGTVLIAI